MSVVPVYVGGGFGDFILSLAWIQNVLKPLNMSIHLYSLYPELGFYFLPWLEQSQGMDNNNHEKNNFDFFIAVSDLVAFAKKPGVSLPEKLKWIFNACQKTHEDWLQVTKNRPRHDNEMAHKALSLGQTRWTLPFYTIGKQYVPFEFDSSVLKPIKIPNKFITVHDGFDSTGTYKFMRSMKSWDIIFWEEFVDLFKKQFPDIAVVQLGGVKHQKIKNVDLNLAGQLSFEKSIEYLNSSLLHVDGDSGLVHARYILKKKSIVLFGPTNYKYFGYPENENIPPNFCGDCWWKDSDKPISTWMEKCMKGYDSPKCIDSIYPGMVLERVKNYLAGTADEDARAALIAATREVIT